MNSCINLALDFLSTKTTLSALNVPVKSPFAVILNVKCLLEKTILFRVCFSGKKLEKLTRLSVTVSLPLMGRPDITGSLVCKNIFASSILLSNGKIDCSFLLLRFCFIGRWVLCYWALLMTLNLFSWLDFCSPLAFSQNLTSLMKKMSYRPTMLPFESA